ncbi:MAG: hypothetical protein INQ03_24970 [Candidatus Heimdallarchaeota archaeon]|nr:hypothetical protein [Candidatus Heimdallarchaeota archaeon]
MQNNEISTDTKVIPSNAKAIINTKLPDLNDNFVLWVSDYMAHNALDI